MIFTHKWAEAGTRHTPRIQSKTDGFIYIPSWVVWVPWTYSILELCGHGRNHRYVFRPWAAWPWSDSFIHFIPERCGKLLIHLLNAERLNIERPNSEWLNAKWPNTERLNAESDPTPNRDPTLNDRTPNDPTSNWTQRRIGLNTEFEHRNTER